MHIYQLLPERCVVEAARAPKAKVLTSRQPAGTCEHRPHAGVRGDHNTVGPSLTLQGLSLWATTLTPGLYLQAPITAAAYLESHGQTAKRRKTLPETGSHDRI